MASLPKRGLQPPARKNRSAQSLESAARQRGSGHPLVLYALCAIVTLISSVGAAPVGVKGLTAAATAAVAMPVVGVPPAASTSPIPCSGIQIVPGYTADRIQQLVDSRPAGTQFCFASGTYVLNHYIFLRQADQFICPVRRTCILTGLDQFRGGLAAVYGTSHQLIKGFVVERFTSLPGVWPNAGLQARDFALLEDNESRYNQIGITVGSNQTLRGNFVHHNRQYGISGGPAANVLIENNEVSFNNTAQYDPNDDAGGSKIIGGQAGTSGLTWRRNYVHDNYGNGIWSDGNVRYVLYEENLVQNNAGNGITHEISWNSVMRNNWLKNNNTADLNLGKSCWHGAQIGVNNSQNVYIYGNNVEAAGTNALCVVNALRADGPPFPQSLANVYVYGNAIKMRGEVYVGMVGNAAPANVVFWSNTYYIDNPASAKWVYLKPMTGSQWQAAGHDSTGRFFTW